MTYDDVREYRPVGVVTESTTNEVLERSRPEKDDLTDTLVVTSVPKEVGINDDGFGGA